MVTLALQILVGLVGVLATAVVAAFVALLVAHRKREAAARAKVQREQRRLKEQLRHEQLRNEAFRRVALQRLDSHDRVLRLDTRRNPELAAGPGDGEPPPPPPHWHYAHNGSSVGPVPEATVRVLLERGDLDPSTLVWCKGQETWLPARSVDAFRDVVRAS